MSEVSFWLLPLASVHLRLLNDSTISVDWSFMPVSAALVRSLRLGNRQVFIPAMQRIRENSVTPQKSKARKPESDHQGKPGDGYTYTIRIP